MKSNICCIFFCLFISWGSVAISQTLRVYGSVTDEERLPLESVNVIVKGATKGVSTDKNGFFEISFLEREDTITLQFRLMGFLEEERKIIAGKTNKEVTLSVVLKESSIELEGYSVQGFRKQTSSVEILDVSKLKVMPDASGGGIEALLSTQPGVSSRNELSSQYSVRGGN